MGKEMEDRVEAEAEAGKDKSPTSLTTRNVYRVSMIARPSRAKIFSKEPKCLLDIEKSARSHTLQIDAAIQSELVDASEYRRQSVAR